MAEVVQQKRVKVTHRWKGDQRQSGNRSVQSKESFECSAEDRRRDIHASTTPRPRVPDAASRAVRREWQARSPWRIASACGAESHEHPPCRRAWLNPSASAIRRVFAPATAAVSKGDGEGDSPRATIIDRGRVRAAPSAAIPAACVEACRGEGLKGRWEEQGGVSMRKGGNRWEEAQADAIDKRGSGEAVGADCKAEIVSWRREWQDERSGAEKRRTAAKGERRVRNGLRDRDVAWLRLRGKYTLESVSDLRQPLRAKVEGRNHARTLSLAPHLERGAEGQGGRMTIRQASRSRSTPPFEPTARALATFADGGFWGDGEYEEKERHIQPSLSSAQQRSRREVCAAINKHIGPDDPTSCFSASLPTTVPRPSPGAFRLLAAVCAYSKAETYHKTAPSFLNCGPGLVSVLPPSSGLDGRWPEPLSSSWLGHVLLNLAVHARRLLPTMNQSSESPRAPAKLQFWKRGLAQADRLSQPPFVLSPSKIASILYLSRDVSPMIVALLITRPITSIPQRSPRSMLPEVSYATRHFHSATCWTLYTRRLQPLRVILVSRCCSQHRTHVRRKVLKSVGMRSVFLRVDKVDRFTPVPLFLSSKSPASDTSRPSLPTKNVREIKWYPPRTLRDLCSFQPGSEGP
ncbi:hypothetical protein B0H13DRAFT_1873232 [Mycena leptocephala]|nr:hypothetical protein B0H13DRAFT_1873232 [Mycena leptocephala]